MVQFSRQFAQTICKRKPTNGQKKNGEKMVPSFFGGDL